MIHPISFSVPEEKIFELTDVRLTKKRILSELIPGDVSTYIYSTEEDYYHQYRESYFAVTKKKGGWDCMRHYEIMANGCVPLFLSIEDCPVRTMALCPKDLFVEAKRLFYDRFVDKEVESLTKEDIAEYTLLLKKITDYTKQYLTTTEMAKYVVHKSGLENVSKILYLSGSVGPDYLRCLTLHGLKKLFGPSCHDYPKIEHLYKCKNIKYHELYGKGMTYTNLIDSTLRNDDLDKSIKEDIVNKRYDMIIYGSYHRGMPFYDTVCHTYEPNRIIMMCGEDLHGCDYANYVEKNHSVFVREL